MQGKLPHIEWLDLKGDGVLHECAIMKRDPNGNIYFFKVEPIDGVDKKRLRDIITGRNATMFPLWDLMRQNRLGNGINALDYFHQLVRVLTPSGSIMEPQYGVVGAAAQHAGPTAAQMAETSDLAQTVQVEAAPVQETVAEVGEADTRTPAEKRAATIAAKKAAQE
ncbi:MAG: hypothetical protein JXR12_01365 [Neptunomonas phycophila]|uniref:hypothetical protein n=1 Tax=Neptunomonas phycophila TaxID=1572645 RepID=UPI003B8E8BE9